MVRTKSRGFGWFSTSDAVFLIIGFVVIRTIDGYAQSFGSPGMVKINAAWFRRNERGTFAGIFGGMIQLGQIGVNWLSRALLTGAPLAIFGLTIFVFPKLDWRSMFIVPPIILAILLVLMWLNVRNQPEEAGYAIDHDDQDGMSYACLLDTIEVSESAVTRTALNEMSLGAGVALYFVIVGFVVERVILLIMIFGFVICVYV